MPETSPRLPFRSGGFATLTEGLDYAATGGAGMTFFSGRGEPLCVLPYRELRLQACRLARRLAGLRLERGAKVALVAETSAEFVVTFFACQYAGLVPVPLPLCINIGGRAAYVHRLRGMLEAAGASIAIAPADLVELVAEAAHGSSTGWVGTAAAVGALPMSDGGLEPLRADEPCYLQYSSGSTSFPRGVLVTQRAIAANAEAIATSGLRLGANDRCVSWLPLYHDMGLVGCCLTPVMTQIPVDYLPSTAFARRPLLWLELISRRGGTISFGPTFGFELCTRRAQKALPPGLDLRRWRVAGIGGEMIRPSVLEAFSDTFAAAGFDHRALVPSYGLAEATLALTFAPLGHGLKVDRVASGHPLEVQRRANPARSGPARSFVVCGHTMPGYEIEIRDQAGRPQPDRHVGRVCARGPSLMAGYYRNAAATAAALLGDGWLDTGDLGYLIDGELVITGRSKDLIIVGGRNIWPQDLEWAVEQLEDLRAGDVAAFAVGGEGDQERAVVVVECRAKARPAQETLRAAIAAEVRRVAGIECEVILAPPRSLSFTTSGKLSRAATKADYLMGAIRDLADTPAARARAELEQLPAAG